MSACTPLSSTPRPRKYSSALPCSSRLEPALALDVRANYNCFSGEMVVRVISLNKIDISRGGIRRARPLEIAAKSDSATLQAKIVGFDVSKKNLAPLPSLLESTRR